MPRNRDDVFRRVLARATAPLWLVADDGEVLLVSDRARRLTGVLEGTPEEWGNRVLGRREARRAPVTRLLAGPDPVQQTVIEVRGRDEPRRWDVYAALVGRAPDDRHLALCVANDVTGGRQEREREVARRDAALAAIVSSSDDAILSKTLDGIIQTWNRGAENLYQYSAAEAIGSHIDLIVPENRRRELEHIFVQLRRGERVDHLETVRRRKDGSLIDISLTVSPLIGPGGDIVGASAVARDISERKRAEEMLREADRQKDRFLAVLGHELRNPLAAISTASELLAREAGDEPTLQRLNSILSRQTQVMARLLDGLLDVTRIARGKIKLKTEPLLLNHVIAEVIASFSPSFQKEGVALVGRGLEDEIWIEGDSVRLHQIFDNLLSNALKFSPAGAAVTVELSRGDSKARVSVRDRGAGIDPELLPHIFEPFRQGPQRLDRPAGGLGLGLALVRGLVELHGGTIRARSAGERSGTELTVELPVTARRPADEEPSHHSSPGYRVLVVEDNLDAAELLAELLESNGCRATVANDGESAVELARAELPEVVLCDIGLPGQSGYQVAEALRDHPGLEEAILIAISGYGSHSDEIHALESGFDAHLTKPVTIGDINDAIARARERRGPGA